MYPQKTYPQKASDPPAPPQPTLTLQEHHQILRQERSEALAVHQVLGGVIALLAILLWLSRRRPGNEFSFRR